MDLFFAGSRVHEIKEILPIKTIINNIMSEYKLVRKLEKVPAPFA
ncbi:hypothetical protein [Neobacillus cucumis]|nr:hypothetical protein [Neobacillus cucumis]MDR4950201.1 hypothetical protein [Neobacillus cucumis]